MGCYPFQTFKCPFSLLVCFLVVATMKISLAIICWFYVAMFNILEHYINL